MDLHLPSLWLTLSFFALLADFDDDAGVSEDDDGEGQEVEEADAENGVDHQGPGDVLEEPECHALSELGVQRMALHIEDYKLQKRKVVVLMIRIKEFAIIIWINYVYLFDFLSNVEVKCVELLCKGV